MGIEGASKYAGVLAGLGDADWVRVLGAVPAAATWIGAADPGDPRINELVSQLVTLAGHAKWEVRRAVANAAAAVVHPAFEPVLARLTTDDNARVRHSAEHAALRRRDWRHVSALGKQHEERINATLDDIEARFGARGRDAVRRASEEMANTFARELYHEVVKLLTPLAMSVDRLRNQLSDQGAPRKGLVDETVRIGERVMQLRAVLDAMRVYTASPRLTFAAESLKDIVDEAALLALAGESRGVRPAIEVHVDATITVEVARARLIQAITNVLVNALESYDGRDRVAPVMVRAEVQEGRVVLAIADSGCGMSEEALKDAGALFATSKANGTGFGLPLAIKILESEHGGRLSLESAIDKGTVVRLVIPTHRWQESA